MDKTKFENTIIATMPKLQRLACNIVRLFSFGDAQDLLQECLLRMLSHSDTFDETKGSVYLMACVVMKNLQITEYHRRKMLMRVDGFNRSPVSADDDILGTIQAKQMLAHYNNEAHLSYWGYSIDEISQITGRARITVIDRLNANIDYLRAETGYRGKTDRRKGRLNLGRRRGQFAISDNIS